jgi:hypothetical protein
VRAAALALAMLLALPARAEPCPPGDELCELADEVIRLDADLDVARLRVDALTRTLALCEARTCPPPPAPSLWPVVASGAVGVALGVILAGLLAR